MSAKHPSEGDGKHPAIIVAVNGDFSATASIEDFPENVNYDVETLLRSPPIRLQGVMPDGVRPSPDGVAKIRSAVVGDPTAEITLVGDRLIFTVQEALLVVACPET